MSDKQKRKEANANYRTKKQRLEEINAANKKAGITDETDEWAAAHDEVTDAEKNPHLSWWHRS